MRGGRYNRWRIEGRKGENGGIRIGNRNGIKD